MAREGGSAREEEEEEARARQEGRKEEGDVSARGKDIGEMIGRKSREIRIVCGLFPGFVSRV